MSMTDVFSWRQGETSMAGDGLLRSVAIPEALYA